MKRTSHFLHTGIAVLALAAGTAAQAQDFYVSGSLGRTFADDISTNGSFARTFTTGTVTGVNPPLQIPAGAPVRWRTNIDDSNFYSVAFGLDTDFLRYEFEYSRAKFDIDSHRDVTAAGLALGALDAGVLIAGNVGDLGISVANLVADGRGEIDTASYMLNVYYDFDLGMAVLPYIGVGIGNTTHDVNYRPGGVQVIDDEANQFSWQLLAGLSYDINDVLKLQGTWRFRDGEDAGVRSTLLPARFDLGSSGTHTLEVGIRYAF